MVSGRVDPGWVAGRGCRVREGWYSLFFKRVIALAKYDFYFHVAIKEKWEICTLQLFL